MTNSHRPRDRDNDRQARIDELKQQAKELADGALTAWESDALGPEEREQFWQRVVAWETAPSTNHFQQLVEVGLEPPDPNTVDEEDLSSTLWQLIEALARIRVFIGQTDHLSDRELYTVLWHEVIREEIPMLPVDGRSAWHVDLLSSGSEADVTLYLKYYADEEWRQHWLVEFPDDALPAHEDPPFDRDRHLPQPYEDLP